jgi:hypothetical protein
MMSKDSIVIVRRIRHHQSLLITISLVLVALPFVALSFYNHPSLDDILDAVTVKQLGFWLAQKHFYLTLTGRYTTTVLLASVNPLLYVRMEAHWWMVALGFMLGTLVVLQLCIALLPGLSRGATWRGAGVLLCLWLTYAPGQAEGLYWFTGAYTYVATAWLLLLWLVVFVRYKMARRGGQRSNGWLLGVIGLTLAVAGTVEPVALPFLLALLAAGGFYWWLKRSWLLLALAGIAAAGCMVSFTAPGNLVRMTVMGQPFGLIKAGLYSLATASYLFMTWVANPVLLAVSALVLPTLQRIAQRREQLLVRMLARIPSGILTGMLVLLLAAGNCPAYYASGTGLPLRARTTLYLLFLVGWFSVLLTWCCRQTRFAPSSTTLAPHTGRLVPLWTGLLLLFFCADYNVQTRASRLGQGSNNVIRAYRQWLSGEAARYDAEMRARYRVLATGGPVVAIEPLQNRPELLYCFDVAGMDNPSFLRGYADYFGVKQVLTVPLPPETVPK